MYNSETPFVSVIIPVYNDPIRLKICLQALEDQTYPKHAYEVIVVDNGSDENIETIVAGFSQVKQSYEAQPGSYAARNKGLSLAQGKVIAFTDSDCIPAPDWIERGVANLLRVPNCGIVGGKVEFFFKNPADPAAFEIWDSMTYLTQEIYIEKCKNSVTANLFTFRHVVQGVGTFNQDLKSLGDQEWGQRVVSCGYTLIYADDVCVKHPARHSFAEIHRRMIRTAGGFRDVRRKDNTASLRERVLNLLPSPVMFLRIWRNQHLSVKKKMAVTCVGMLMKYVEIWEKLRIRLWQKKSTR